MADAATWTERVQQWRASGMTAGQFCAEKDFTKVNLYLWASKLRRAVAPKDEVRMARVVRTRPPKAGVREETLSMLMIEMGSTRLFVPRGVDRATLETVIHVLEARAR
jgi:transposase